ncbi:MAG: hypothetical protein FWG90_10370 [Oscillospiraceae bacterium]|nr:hypothetical protein [Oscillospiraceae bacterium]
MKKLAAITLAAIILLSACGKSTPPLESELTTSAPTISEPQPNTEPEEKTTPHESAQTTKEMTEEITAVEANEEITIQTTRELSEEEVRDLEEMPEIVFLLIQNSTFSGNTAEGLIIDNNGIIKEFSLSYDQFPPWSNVNLGGVVDKIITNYNKFIEYSEDTGRNIDKEELTKHWELLEGIEKKSNIIMTKYSLDVDVGYAGYYGVRKNLTGELEVIPLKGRGNMLYDNTDPLTEEICDWLVKVISFEDAGIEEFGIEQYPGKWGRKEVYTLES